MLEQFDIDLAERWRKFLYELRLKQTDVARDMGMSSGNVNDWVKGRSYPGFRALGKLVKTYKVNANWLLTGEGEMLLSGQGKAEPQATPPATSSKALDDLKKENHALKITLTTLMRITPNANEKLTAAIDDLVTKIDDLVTKVEKLEKDSRK